MPVVRINAIGDTVTLHRSPRSPRSVLRQTRDTQGPVIIMTHGYKYRPEDGKACPHRHILAFHPTPTPWHCPSWPQQLGFGSGFDDEGLGIAFGWNAQGPLWAARRRAVEAGRALADMVRYLRRLNPNRPIHFIGHSMGTELALEALHYIQPGSLNRIISMTGAAYQSRTLSALETPAGRQAEFINVTSRENDVFDFMYEWLIQPPKRGDRSIGLGFEAPNAVTLQIDCHDTLEHLSRMIFPVGTPQRRVCHWSSYTRPGVLRVYNALLRNQDHLSLHQLRGGVPEQSDRRWSRLFALPCPYDLLPFAQKAS
ncbi:alpha/beta fold hydrolase [Ruegeria sp. Ofav3-42]|uniref:alpha/beta fold hydrolase n=1 Tax=Ruegeria sp. Ofav3-42 TaxID=2917759 RepID=UPI001EF4A2BD|nr:alpha/beta fold hydrolase [Ruegeria sp. Ofav3-42]MCG7519682.1 alpha/beta fold hydrolase [Ruegeria sp. Ofav3-42]